MPILATREWDDVRCVEVAPGTDPAALHRELSELLEPAPSPAAVEDLLQRDERPHVDPPEERSPVRRTSAFDVLVEESGAVSFRMVEFLSGPGWLVVCWHEPIAYGGAERLPGAGREPQSSQEIWAAVARRWGHCEARTGGDLGVLVLAELTLTYAPASRALAERFEDWEIATYDSATEDEPPTMPWDIWGSVVRFRSWLAPLNPAGVKADLAKAWFADVTWAAGVAEVDGRVDRTLSRLGELARELREAFAGVHDARQRRRSDLFEQLGVVALVPTFIASFYGANTRLPGGATWGGFVAMIVAMVVLTLAALFALRRHQSARRRQALGSAASR